MIAWLTFLLYLLFIAVCVAAFGLLLRVWIGPAGREDDSFWVGMPSPEYPDPE